MKTGYQSSAYASQVHTDSELRTPVTFSELCILETVDNSKLCNKHVEANAAGLNVSY